MEPYSIHKTKNETSTKDRLSSSLKHLEFILFFELYLESKHVNIFSRTFLNEFENIKYEAQMNVLKHSIHSKESQNNHFHSSTLNGYSPTVNID